MTRLLKRRLPALLAAISALALLSGCWQAPAEPEEVGGVSSSGSAEQESTALPKEMALPYSAAETLDPITCPDGAQQVAGALLYEGLYELDETMAPQYRLCTGGACDEAALVWTFTLRGGVTFSDGSALTAADAADALNRARESGRYRARLANVQSVSASGGALTVTLRRANAHLPALLDIPIVKSGTQADPVPIGTGPYRYAADGDGAFLVKHDAWWAGDPLPVERIRLVNCENQDAARYQFTSHAVQLLTADLTGTEPVSATGSFDFLDADTTVFQYVGFNLRRPLLADAALRRALSLGIDRNTLVSAYLSGHARPAQFPVSPVWESYPAGLEQSYSYAGYESAMAAAGYSTGTAKHTLRLIVNSENSFKVSAAKAVAEALSAFDLQVEAEALPWEEFTAALAAGNYDLYYGEVKLTADWDLTGLLGTGGGLNYGGFSDPALDALLLAYGASADPAAAMEAVCRTLQAQCPILPLCFKTVSVLSQQGVVEHLRPTAANPFYDLTSCTIRLAK